MAIPRSLAREGTRPASLRALSSSSAVAPEGTPPGRTLMLTGEVAAASSRRIQRGGGVSAVRPLLAASARREANSPGRRPPGSGGLEDMRSARTVWPSLMSELICSSHSARADATRASTVCRRRPRRDRPGSSRPASSALAAMVRSSRSGKGSGEARAASARSHQVAALRRGSRDSAIARIGSAGTSGCPASRAATFCSSMARRTAGSPPATRRSAITRCSGERESRSALRCTDGAAVRALSGRLRGRSA